MKMNRLFLLSMLGILLVAGCGKPSDPESILPDNISGGYTVLAKIPTSGFAQDIMVKDTLAYVAQGEGGLLIINVKDHNNPLIVSVTTEEVRGYSSKIAVRDSVVYIAAGTFGISVVDISDPWLPEVTVSNLNMKPAKNIHLFGNYMFTAVSELGLRIAEISYPAQPDIRGGITMEGFANGIATTSDSAYVFIACGEMGMSVFNISDFQDGFGEYPLTGWCDTPGYAEAVVLDESKSLAYLACGTAGLQILDYSDTNNIRIIGKYATGGYAEELILKDNRVFMTTQKSGFQVIDVSVPASPKLIGLIDTELALGIAMDDDYVYIADEVEGLIVIARPGISITK